MTKDNPKAASKTKAKKGRKAQKLMVPLLTIRRNVTTRRNKIHFFEDRTGISNPVLKIGLHSFHVSPVFAHIEDLLIYKNGRPSS